MAWDGLSFGFRTADEGGVRIRRAHLGLLTLGWALVGPPGAASADRVVNANEPVVVSDDISNRIRIVRSRSELPPPTGASEDEAPTGGGNPPGGDVSGGGAGSGGSKGNEVAPQGG